MINTHYKVPGASIGIKWPSDTSQIRKGHKTNVKHKMWHTVSLIQQVKTKIFVFEIEPSIIYWDLFFQ